jgi:hypothetical protein
MSRPRISYSIKPSFEPEKALTVAVGWVDRRKQYCVDVKRGAKTKRKWIDSDSRLDEIMAASASLDLPLLSEGPEGLDGTGYSFKIGITPSVEFSWWQELPDSWIALADIIQQMSIIADEMTQ